MTVEQSEDAKSLEFAAQVEEPNGRKVKIAGQVSYSDPQNPGCKGSPSQPCNGLHSADGPTCPSCCLKRSGGTSSKTPYPQADASSWVRNKQFNGEEEEDYDPDPSPGLGVTCGRGDAEEEKALKDRKDKELGRTGTSSRWRQLERKDKELWCRSPDGYATSSDEEVVSKWFEDSGNQEE